MPTIHAADENEREYRLVCKGLDKTDVFELYRKIEGVGEKPRFRNPFPQNFDAKAIHEIIVVAGYMGKKVVDILAGVIENTLKGSPKDKMRTVTIYGPDGAVASEVEIQPRKPKR
jgi:ATP-dependent exoDNAse (exonuclease V) alpha subunit